MVRISGKMIDKEYLRQDFYPHELSNGTIIMVSYDGHYYYE